MSAAPLLGDGAVTDWWKDENPPTDILLSHITFICEIGSWRRWAFSPTPVLSICTAVCWDLLCWIGTWLRVFGHVRNINWQDSRWVWHGLGLLLPLIVSLKSWQVSKRAGGQVRTRLWYVLSLLPCLGFRVEICALLNVQLCHLVLNCAWHN